MKIVDVENKKVVLMGPKEYDTLPYLYRIALKEIEKGLTNPLTDEAKKQVLIERKKIIQKMMKETPTEEE